MGNNIPNGRIPVRPLPYNDRDLAMTREIIIDYDKGNIYITDKDDPTILIDITKLIADSYLSNINGDNTTVTINGEVYNLSSLLAELKKEKIKILNTADSSSVPAGLNYDQDSLSLHNNIISIYGFEDAEDMATPMKKDGQLIWKVERKGPTDNPMEPQPGDKENTILILPTNDSIILYNKPQMRTYISEVLYDPYIVKLPFSMPVYSMMRWKFDTMKYDVNLSFPENIVWLDPKLTVIPNHTTYILTFDTWDSGRTWLVRYISYVSSTSDSDLPDKTYLVDNEGKFLVDEDNNYLISEEVN